MASKPKKTVKKKVQIAKKAPAKAHKPAPKHVAKPAPKPAPKQVAKQQPTKAKIASKMLVAEARKPVAAGRMSDRN